MTDDPVYRDEDWLERRYWGDGMSLPEMAEDAGTTASTVRRWMDRHGAPRRPVGGRPVPPADLLADVERVCRELGKAPSREEYLELGGHKAQTVARAWGSWSGAKTLAWRRVRFGTQDPPAPR